MVERRLRSFALNPAGCKLAAAAAGVEWRKAKLARPRERGKKEGEFAYWRIELADEVRWRHRITTRRKSAARHCALCAESAALKAATRSAHSLRRPRRIINFCLSLSSPRPTACLLAGLLTRQLANLQTGSSKPAPWKLASQLRRSKITKRKITHKMPLALARGEIK